MKRTIQQILNEQLALLERVRLLQKGFDLKKLSKMNPREAVEYTKQHFERLGTGASRTVFLYSPKKVLKIAKNTFGYEQNKAELAVSGEKFTTKVFDYGMNKKGEVVWLLSELVRPIQTEEEFEKFSGTSEKVLMDFVSKAVVGNSFEKAKKDLEKDYKTGMGLYKRAGNVAWAEDYLRAIEELKKENPWLKELYYFCQEKKLINDLWAHQWGITPDRRLVILDYGLRAIE